MDGQQLLDLEKSAAIGGLAKKYLGNVTGLTARKADKLANIEGTRTARKVADKALTTKKITQRATGVGAIGAAGTIGAAKAYQDSKAPELPQPTIPQPQPIDDEMKLAGEQLGDENMTIIDQLVKVAEEVYGPDVEPPMEAAPAPAEQAMPPEMVDELVRYVQSYEESPAGEEQHDGSGAHSVSHAPAGADKTASDIVDELVKFASGADKDVSDIVDELVKFASEDDSDEKKEPSFFEKREEKKEKDEEKKERPPFFQKKEDGDKDDKDEKKEKKDEQEKEAHELIVEELVKFAAPSLSGIGGKVKDTANTLSGSNIRKTKKELNSLNSAGGFQAAAQKSGDVAGTRNKMEALDSKVKTEKDKTKAAWKSTGKNVGLFGAGAATGSAVSNNKKDREKVASEEAENDMTGLFKEAADHIIRVEIPEVKQYVDPMNLIQAK